MKISKDGLDFIKSFESFVPYVYDDLKPPVKGRYREWNGEKVIGTLTIAYGHTNAAKHPLKVVQGLRVSEAEACVILDVDLDECEEAVNRLVKVTLTQGQYDCLVSFAFNCGVGNLKKLIVPLNRGDYAATRAKLGAYVKSKGKTLRGLVRRRKGEQALWDAKSPALPTAPVHHPAEVEEGHVVIPAADKPKDAVYPKTTLKEVVATSRKATWLWRFLQACKVALGGLTLGSLAEYAGVAKETMDQVEQFIQQHAIVILATSAILSYFVVKYVLKLMAEDIDDGRYTPSGKTAA